MVRLTWCGASLSHRLSFGIGAPSAASPLSLRSTHTHDDLSGRGTSVGGTELAGGAVDVGTVDLAPLDAAAIDLSLRGTPGSAERRPSHVPACPLRSTWPRL